MPEPEKNFGVFIPSRGQARSATKPGKVIPGSVAEPRTIGAEAASTKSAGWFLSALARPRRIFGVADAKETISSRIALFVWTHAPDAGSGISKLCGTIFGI